MTDEHSHKLTEISQDLHEIRTFHEHLRSNLHELEKSNLKQNNELESLARHVARQVANLDKLYNGIFGLDGAPGLILRIDRLEQDRNRIVKIASTVGAAIGAAFASIVHLSLELTRK